MELGYPADQARSYRSIEQDATRVRGIIAPRSNAALPSGVALFEGLERQRVVVSGRTIPLSYATKEFPAEVEAATRYDGDANEIVITLAEETYRELEAGDTRARFTLAHEIGHAILHPQELVRLSQIPHTQASLLRGRFATHQICQDTEWQANAFSGALLMPAQVLRDLERTYGVLTINTVQERFAVGYQAAQKRLEVYRRMFRH
jgi:hypothetical protein